MGLRKKISLILISMMLAVLVSSYIIIYILFSNAMVKEVINYQKIVVSMNQNIIIGFINSIEQTALQLISDKAMGKYLSTNTLDPLKRIQAQINIMDQFSHYSTSQTPTQNSYFYKNTLFLNENIAISDSFEAKSLDTNSYNSTYNVFSNLDVKETSWYRETVAATTNTYLFINNPTDEFCFAKKIESTYYAGPYDPNGIGVMVVSIKRNELEKLLDFSPITPNSSYVLINDVDEILYKSNPDAPSYLFLSVDKTAKSNIVTLGDKQYVANRNPIGWGMSLIFLTPYQDIMLHVSTTINLFIAFAGFIILITALLGYWVGSKITKPIISLSAAIGAIDDTRNFDLSTLNVSTDKEIRILCTSFGHLITYVNNLIEDIKLQGEKQKESELRALQAQINPHFIYNAMDVVNWIALSRNQDDIATIVSSIANLMRYSITAPNNVVSLEQELANIQEFITIHELRHDGKINLEVVTDTPLQQVLIPKFTLQPLVENAIQYTPPTSVQRSKDTNEYLHIKLNITSQKDRIYISISNPVTSNIAETLNDFLAYRPTNLVPTSGFGIRNVNERIQLHFQNGSKLFYHYSENLELVAVIMLCYGAI